MRVKAGLNARPFSWPASTNGPRILGLLLGVLLLAACASLPPAPAHAPEPAFASPETTALGALSSEAARAHPSRSGLLFQDTGRQALVQRALLIEAATRSIDAQYYIWNSDQSGRYLACRLYAAAERGVRVRLMLDDMNVAGRDALLAALDDHANIEIRIYNPNAVRGGPRKWLSLATEFERMNRRMHNKSFVADAAFGIVGGRNIGDEYFDLHPEVNFRDRDVLAIGPVVAQIAANFDTFWNSTLAYPIRAIAPRAASAPGSTLLATERCASADEAAALLGSAPRDPAGALEQLAGILPDLSWAGAELVFDLPARLQAGESEQPGRTALVLQALADSATREVLVESAYLLLAEAQLETVRAMVERGVRVAAVTNSLATNDLVANHSGYARRRLEKLSSGLELHELKPDAAACALWIEGRDDCGTTAMVSLHSKSAVFDRRTVAVGSFNFNLRSMYLNSETVLVIHSEELADQLAEAIELAMAPANSWQVRRAEDGSITWVAEGGETWTREPATGFWQRFKSSLLRLVPMDKYL